MRVVADQDSARTPLLANGTADLSKRALQRIAFIDRGPQRMMWVNAIHGQRRFLHVGALERLNVVANCLVTAQKTVGVKLNQHGRDFQQGVSLAVETAGLNVYDNGQETAKAVRHSNFISHLLFSLEQILVEDCTHRVADTEPGEL